MRFDNICVPTEEKKLGRPEAGTSLVETRFMVKVDHDGIMFFNKTKGVPTTCLKLNILIGMHNFLL